MRIAAACALLAVAFASTVGCARKDWIDRTLVTENVSGSWYGAMGGLRMGQGRVDIWLTLKQEGGKITGEFHTSGFQASWVSSEGSLEGTMNGDVLRFNDVRRTFTGELTVSGDEMEGYIGRSPTALHRVESSSAAPPSKP